ncbi:uroporphyrinogen-III synthase [Undibacterium sp. Jales W-56]|uniref:uroporphyrinogen-III synthase n=1 Tax=Undibacterium sp. Jales W-56 TaxID=2897325 RepID=UPI0021D17AAB|nr:uroporphyrinogen-III synthase [Undibacterium sp. Jales W-56]MCU6433716.1 uroporphyrinogen-III synthase [Undibacterium sp. Jales W-56]
MPNPVVLTRPAEQAADFAARISAMGRVVIPFPLLEIHGLDDYAELDRVLANLADFALIAFVSPNAIRAVFSRIKSLPPQLAVAVMGQGSLAALAEFGVQANDTSNANTNKTTIFYPRNPERTDSETLLDELDLPALQSKKVLIVRGETGRELLAERLRAHGIDVTQVAAYRRAAPVFTSARRQLLTEMLESQNDWIVTSSEALQTAMVWAQQLGHINFVAKLQHQHLIVPHVRIAETAQQLGFKSITLSGSGDEHLLVALQSRL